MREALGAMLSISSNAAAVQKAISGAFRDYLFFRRPQGEGEPKS